VVTVLIALLAMAAGFESTLKGTGQTDRAIIMRSGSTAELSSNISNANARIVETKPGLLVGSTGTLAAGETYAVADIPKRASKTDANLPMRGVESKSFEIRDELKITSGRSFEFGRYELIAGVKAADQFQGLDVGNQLKIRGATWEVVGIFETDGSIYESEIWVDNALLVANLNREGSYSSMVVRLESALDFDVFQQALKDDPQLETNVVRETTYYSEQSTGVTSLITQFGYGVGFIMAIGAVFGALNTMYSAVSTRAVEIATLRALGFGPTPVVISVMVESLVLSIVGGLIGGAIAYLVFNGYTASTMSQSTFSQVAFDFSVTEELLVRGIIWSCMLGLIGGLFPSVAAARLPVTVALRGL